MRAIDINDLKHVAVNELVHWAQLRIDFAIVGPPNAGTSSLQKTLSKHPNIRFIDGIHELSVPSSWHRSIELWGWQCTAPKLLPKHWAEDHLIEVMSGKGSTSSPAIVGFRNPKFIYSKQCLQNLKSIPGIKIITMWRDPIDWMWSSLSRAYEGFDTSPEDFRRAWHQLADTDKEVVAMSRAGGGLSELSMWRLGVPLSAKAALLHQRYQELQQMFQDRMLVLPFSWLRDDSLKWIQAASDFLGVSVDAMPLLSHNVRRRRSGPRLEDMASNDTLTLQLFFSHPEKTPLMEESL
ncbi:unnamed protein product [Durusdinium trenchii]|uniref:Uncharacterized protein n=2 Tax=Durusdinium trenchii TaxID=1381693 RepID=A0ABP0PYC9_9DINO